VKVEIRDVNCENLDDFVVRACSPRLDDSNHAQTLKEGGLKKKEWAKKALQTFGCSAKIAYLRDKAVGFIEFYPMSTFPLLPKRDKRTMLITCILVHDRTLQKMGIGSTLVQALIEDLKHRPLPIFDGQKAEEIAIGSWGCHAGFPESRPRFRNFFFKNGFKEDPTFPDPTGKGGILVHSL
jgi:GNAT superfamily N-acetyltransferase